MPIKSSKCRWVNEIYIFKCQVAKGVMKWGITVLLSHILSTSHFTFLALFLSHTLLYIYFSLFPFAQICARTHTHTPLRRTHKARAVPSFLPSLIITRETFVLPWHISLSRQYTGSKGIEDIKGKEGYSFPLHIRSTCFFSSPSEKNKNNGLIHLLRSGGGGGTKGVGWLLLSCICFGW